LRLRLATSGAAILGIGTGRNVAITPDGSRVIYVSTNNQLLVQPLDRLDATVFTGVPPLSSVFVSPDSRWIGFVEGTALRKVALTGGPAATIVQTDPTFGATWSPDDTIIFASSDPTTGLRRISAAERRNHRADTPGSRRTRSSLARDAARRQSGALYHQCRHGRGPGRSGGGARSHDRHLQSGGWRKPRPIRDERAPRLRLRWRSACRSIRPCQAGDEWDGGHGAATGADDVARRW
jgi:hypothetical protein